MRFMQLFLNAEFNCGGSVEREWVGGDAGMKGKFPPSSPNFVVSFTLEHQPIFQ